MENLDLTPSSPPPPIKQGKEGRFDLPVSSSLIFGGGTGLLFRFNLTQIVAFANYMLPVLNISTIFRCVR